MKNNSIIIRALAALSAAALTATLAGCGSPQEEQQQTPEPEAAPEIGLKLNVKADGWSADTSTPVIAVMKQQAFTDEDGTIVYVCSGGEEFASEGDYQEHVNALSEEEKAAHVQSRTECRDANGEPVELQEIYQELSANTEEVIHAKEREYTLSLISPINSDGSIYTTPEPTVVTAAEITDEATPIELVLVPADQVQPEQLEGIVAAVTVATQADPASVSASTLDRAKQNALVNPNATAEEIETAESGAVEAVASGDKQAADVVAASSSSASAATGNDGSSDSGRVASGSVDLGQRSSSAVQAPVSQEPVHTHSFDIPVYGTETYLISKGETRIVCSCGTVFSSYSSWAAHDDALLIETGSGHSYSAQSTPDQYGTRDVVTGHKCSCGAVQ